MTLLNPLNSFKYRVRTKFDKSNLYFLIKKLDSRFHGNDAEGMGLFR